MDRWFILNNFLVKNPTSDQIFKTPKHLCVQLLPSDEGIVKETWYVDVNNNIVTSFSYSLTKPERSIYNERRNHFINCGFDPETIKWLYSVLMPKSWFHENGVELHGYS